MTRCAYNALRSCGKANKLGGPYKLDLSNELTIIHVQELVVLRMREANVRTRLEAGHRGLIHALKINEQVCGGREGRVSLLY
jgi:hypothetical protein